MAMIQSFVRSPGFCLLLGRRQLSRQTSIKIKLSEQRAYFYKGGQLVGVSQLSTGREGLTTPSGSFTIIQKDEDHVSSKYGDYVDSGDNVVMPNVELGKDPKPPGTHFKGAPMPYFMRIVGGVGMHAGYLPGYPASHGCIRMPEFMAENFFRVRFARDAGDDHPLGS